MNLVGGGYTGNGWTDNIHQGGSDCRTQTWQIPVPFDNNDGTLVYATYTHYKAGGLIIYVLNYDNPDQCKTNAMDPVNTWTGALNLGDADYTNSDLAFSRNYNSRRLVQTYAGDSTSRWKNPLGIGWQHNYNIYIEEIQQPGPTVYGCLVHEGAVTNVYKKMASGNYQPKSGNHANLTKSGSTWKLYKSYGETYYFGSSNKLDSITDRNGRKTAFTYSGNYLTQVAGKDNHTLSFSYNADSLLSQVSITENSNAKKLEYRYSPATFVTHADSDTFNLKGTYYLTQVLQHYPTDSVDSLMSLHRYYYDNTNLSMVASILPQDQYTQLDTTWQGNYKKGNRLYVWYDTLGQVIYEEVINGDGDTLLTNDKTTYKAYTRYCRVSQTGVSMDSSLTYVYQQEANIDSAHNPYDTTFTPQPPAANYSLRKHDYHNNSLGREIFIETRPNADSVFVFKYYKDKDFNDTLIISPDNDTTRCVYKTYTLNDTTKYSPNPIKIKFPTGDSSLQYYHAPTADAPSFFLTDSAQDERGRKTCYYYDGHYNLDSLKYPSRYVAGTGTSSIVTDYTYNSKGNLTRVKDPLNDSTYFSYAPDDTGSYLTQTRIDFSPSGTGNEDIITKYKYNTDIGKTDTLIYFRDYPSDSSLVYYTYDVMNRIKETNYPDGTKDVLTYDKKGNLLKKETKAGAAVHFRIEYEYDARDRLTKVKEYRTTDLGWTYDSTRYIYSLNDDLIGFINANDTNGISTRINYFYDAGRLYKVAYPDTTSDSLGYYKDGNLKFKRDRKGKLTAYVYDKRNRLTKKRYFNSFSAYQGFPDSVPSETLAFTYDKAGNMTKMTDKNGTVNYSYDDMDGLDTLDCYQNLLITYEYDQGGNRKKLKVVKYSDTANVYLQQDYPVYDEASRLKHTVVGADTFAFQYWDSGPIKKIDYPNGVKEQNKLTSRNFIEVMTDSVNGNLLFKSDYGYNALGDRDSLTFSLARTGLSALTGTILYNYDELQRVTQVQYPKDLDSKLNKYSYDKTGNRLRKIADADTTNYTYNQRNNQLTGEGGNDYVYDDNGNLTEIHPAAEFDYYYTWDFENRLVKVRRSGSKISDSLRMTYCGLGKRIRKIHAAADTTSYAFDGMYAVAEFGGHLDLKAKYVYANGMLLARYDASPGDTHYYHHDGLGSIMGLTNESGSVEQSNFYDEFGTSLGSWGNVSNHYLYTGQEYDSDVTGAEEYNLRARYYKTGIGRFTSEDPELQAGLQSGSGCNNCSGERNIMFHRDLPIKFNTYQYYYNNPINQTNSTQRFKTKMDCIQALITAWRIYKTDFKWNDEDKFRHCVAFCEINKYCGALMAYTGGYGREWGQEAYHFWTGKGERFCFKDISANNYGIRCPADQTCAYWCFIRFGEHGNISGWTH